MHEKQNDIVFIVDDDEAVRDSISLLLSNNGYRVKTFETAERFLVDYDTETIGVLIADIRMPGMTGLELQEYLIAKKSPLPILFITGHGDVPMAVSTMKKGAVDFLEKPFDIHELLICVEKMLQEAKRRAKEDAETRKYRVLLEKLTTRERQVLERIIMGRLNKQIADDLEISIKTVEAHRSNIMEKLEVSTIADLMRIGLLLKAPNAS